MADSAFQDALRVVRVDPQSDRIEFLVSVDLSRCMTTPAVARRIVAIRPCLPDHTCANGKGPTFSSVICNTPLPHLVEHVAVDLMVEEATDEEALFAGLTEWVDRSKGLARITLSSADETQTRAAFARALAQVNECVRECLPRS